MTTAMDAARHLVAIGYDESCPAESVALSPLRLQRLLYYAQGWSLALLGRPLFADPVEAWQFGPVVPAVYEQFKGHSDGLTPSDVGPTLQPLAAVEQLLLATVWREYNQFTPSQLVAMTHRERPWVDARTGTGRLVIPLQSLAEFFREESARRSRPPLPDPTDVWEAEAQVDRGEAVPAADFFRQLLGNG